MTKLHFRFSTFFFFFSCFNPELQCGSTIRRTIKSHQYSTSCHKQAFSHSFYYILDFWWSLLCTFAATDGKQRGRIVSTDAEMRSAPTRRSILRVVFLMRSNQRQPCRPCAKYGFNDIISAPQPGALDREWRSVNCANLLLRARSLLNSKNQWGPV